jgi:CRISPR-associated exonuclease Cas4
MSDQLMLTLQAALQQLAIRQTAETLGDRATYLGASDIAACPRKTILGKRQTPEANLVTLLRQRRGHMAEEIVAAAFTVAGSSC